MWVFKEKKGDKSTQQSFSLEYPGESPGSRLSAIFFAELKQQERFSLCKHQFVASAVTMENVLAVQSKKYKDCLSRIHRIILDSH